MNHRDDLDGMLSAWLDDPFTPPAPRYLGRVLERTRRTRQRPAWASLERWLPMADKVLQPTTAPRFRTAWLLIIALLVLALTFGIVVVGSRLVDSSPVIPRGGSAVFAFASFVGDASGQTAGDIYLATADGTDVRRLTDGPGIKSHATFSPDGLRIAYRVQDAIEGSGTDSVVVIDAGGRNQVTLATTPESYFGCTDRPGLTWSPDGASLIFSSRTSVPSTAGIDCHYELNIVPTDGSSPAQRLLPPGMNGASARWSGDGSRVAFLGSETVGRTGLYVADIDPSRGGSAVLKSRQIGPDLGPTLTDGSRGPEWSPDGTELAVAVVKTGFFITEAEGIYVVKADGSEQRLLSPRAGDPVWSPDGHKLAFHRTVDPAEYWNERPCTVRIWIIDADGTNERRLEPLADGCEGPVLWSPDGSRVTGVLIASTPDEPTLGFHAGVIAVDGNAQMVLSQDGVPTNWQPVAAPLPEPISFPTGSRSAP
jgi:Tol biopolymer transport system component